MPIQRNDVTNLPAVQMRPTPQDDGYGNVTNTGPDRKVGDVTAGVIPEDIRLNPYRTIGGGVQSLPKWLLIVRGALALALGDAIVVTEGIFAGKYRVEIIEQVPQEAFLLAQCIKE